MRARFIVASGLSSVALVACLATVWLAEADVRGGAGKAEVLPEGEGGAAIVRGRVVPGTSAYVGDPCEHVLRIAHKRGELDVRSPDCAFPVAFHAQTALDVVVTGTVHDGVLRARQIEPQLGGCCGGPHCYPVD